MKAWRKSALSIAGPVALFIAAAGIATARSAPAQATDPAPASFTAAQAASGLAEYKANCADCHGANLNDGEFGGPPLKGEAFRAKWFGRPPSALIGFTRAAMPPDSPGRLPLGTYVEIAAYLLSANGIAPGEQTLPADMKALGELRIEKEKAGGSAAR
ncbi:MAG: hypothetical protein JWN66_2375 [Sphingomonas bacterium]|uniref:c-type cytochrome n=1 Tax=Sphingomonas bacterium TaxID=1895847 RepID=UPI002638B45C|nr:cytochrome c [Sphingomonas bacterium]MDB5705259.1 hypothetical protein [Sphingomonas bacterium]